MKKIISSILAVEARLIIRKHTPFIVAVTGSVGKTSTKDAIYDALKSSSRYVRKSQKSLNSEIGLPLTIIGAPNAWRDPMGWMKNIWSGLTIILSKGDYPDILVLELGADHPGDIEKVTRWLKPDIAVMTRVSRKPVHVEFFDSPEQVFREKSYLAEAVRPGGALVYYADDERMDHVAGEAEGRGVKAVSFGLNDGADIRAAAVESSVRGLSFNIECGGQSVPMRLEGALGMGYVHSLLAAVAVGVARGMSLEAAASALSGFEAPKGRMNVIPGIAGSVIIDDTYNSSPDAAEAALEALGGIACSGRRIAVMGDMMELGKYAAEEHRRIGVIAAGKADRLYTVGQRSRLTAEEAVKSGMPAESVKAFDDSSQAALALTAEIREGDVVLVKGSQSVRMERVSKAIMADPGKASELLVRQERQWLEKK